MSYIDVGVIGTPCRYIQSWLFSPLVCYSREDGDSCLDSKQRRPPPPQFYSWQQQEEQKKEKEKDGSSFILLCIETERSFFLNDYFLILCVCVCVCSVEEKKETESGWFSLDCIW